MPTATFLVCTECDEVYPNPQDACPNCQAEDCWNDWLPETESYPNHARIQDIIVGLLDWITESSSVQDTDGALFSTVRDALVVLSTMRESPFTYLYLEDDEGEEA